MTIDLSKNTLKSVDNKQLITLKLLLIIRDVSQKHGLKHSDFQAYRTYCSSRIRRLRSSLHFVQGNKKNFRRKDLTVDVIQNDRYLQIALMTIERAWAYAMQLKQECDTEPRKRFHLVGRLKKAAKHSAELYMLVDQSQRCDARTKLEVQAYMSYMQGTLDFELRQWQQAMANYTLCKDIYEKIAQTLFEEEAEVYVSKAKQIEPALRFCAYNIGDKSMVNEFMSFSTSCQDEMLQRLIEETRSHHAATLDHVTWRGRQLPVTQQKVRTFLHRLKSLDEREYDKVAANIEMYDSVLVECKEAIRVLREDMMLHDNMYKNYQPGSDSISSQHHLLIYLCYLRSMYTVYRNQCMVDSFLRKISEQECAQTTEGRKIQLQDIVRLYDINIQSMKEIVELPGLDNDSDMNSFVESHVLCFQAFRAYQIAKSYFTNEKWRESKLLYEFSQKSCQRSLSSPLLQEYLKEELVVLVDKIEVALVSARAYNVLVSDNQQGKLDQDSLLQETNQSLVNRLDVYNCHDSVLAHVCNDVPPRMAPVQCKPLFFDISLNHIELPDLLETEGGGVAASTGATARLTGLMKGLWGWGSGN